MSTVTGVVLCCSCAEEDDGRETIVLLKKINAWLGIRNFGALIQGEDSFGGSKHPQMHVVGAGFNRFPEDEFSAFVLSLPWRYPENFVLIMQPEDGKTRVFRPEGFDVA